MSRSMKAVFNSAIQRLGDVLIEVSYVSRYQRVRCIVHAFRHFRMKTSRQTFQMLIVDC